MSLTLSRLVPQKSYLPFWAYLGLGAALITAFSFQDIGPTKAIIRIAITVSAVSAISYGAFRNSDSRRAWILFAIGNSCWIVGDIIYQTLLVTGGKSGAPFPSLADPFYLLGYVILISGAISLLKGRHKKVVASDVLDGLMIFSAVALVIWTTLISPIAHQHGSTLWAKVVSAGYPIGDTMLLAALIPLIFFAKAKGSPTFSLLLTSFSLLLSSDLLYAYLLLTGNFKSGGINDLAWTASYVAFGSAALHPSAKTLSSHINTPWKPISWVRMSCLIIALLISPILILFEFYGHEPIYLPLVATSSILSIFLVGTRVWLLRNKGAAAARELAESNKKLIQLDSMKDEFIAMVSHELRTPLTSIRGYSEMLTDEKDDPLSEEKKKWISVIDRNSKRLLSLVDDLLLMAQLENGKMNLVIEEVSLQAIIQNAVTSALPRAGEKEQTIAFYSDEEYWLKADEHRLGQVFDNLLSNAMKFTPIGGAIDINVSQRGGFILVRVRDNGMGISLEDQKKLFTRFFRTDQANEQAISGTGLGLTITKAIVENHGGNISVESEEGKGTTFSLTLPSRPTLIVKPPTPTLASI